MSKVDLAVFRVHELVNYFTMMKKLQMHY